MAKRTLPIVLSLVVVAITGCAESPTKPTERAPEIGTVPGTQVKEYDLTVPEQWQAQHVPTIDGRRIVDSRFLIPTDQGEVQVSVSRVRPGFTTENMDRWIAQIDFEPNGTGPDRRTQTISGVQAMVVDCVGTFRGEALPRMPRNNVRLLGIFIPHQPKDIAIRVIGPADAVRSAQSQIDVFLEKLILK